MNAMIKTSRTSNIGSIGMIAVAFSSVVAALYVMLSGSGLA
jgi:hypothetical protein